MNIKTKLVALGTCVVAAGCSPLAPRPDPSKFFILTPLSDRASPAAAPASTTASAQLAIGVGPIDFPDYLRRAEVVTRVAPNQIDLSHEKRWGEPLDRNFARVLSANLAQLLNTQRIEKYPWPRKTQVDYQIAIDVQRFETTADGQSQLVARWIIKDGQNGNYLCASETTASAPAGSGDTGPSAALSSDLAKLSREIASRLIELSQHRARTTSAIGSPRNDRTAVTKAHSTATPPTGD